MIDAVKAIYPEEIREPLQWLFGYYIAQCGASRAHLCAKLTSVGHSYDQSYVYKFLTGGMMENGKFKGSIPNWTAAIEALQQLTRWESRNGQFPMIETETVRIIRDALDNIRGKGRICKWAVLTAETGRGKSYGVSQYKIDNNHGLTTYIEAPAIPMLSHLVHLLFKRMCGGDGKTYYIKEESLLSEVKEEKLIIIDNAQRLYNPKGGARRQDCFSFLQKLQDETKCSIALIFVKDVQTEFYSLEDMLRGPAKGFFRQFIGRIGGIHRIIHLPSRTCDADLRKFAAAAGYTDEDATRLLPVLRHLDQQEGNLRVLLQALQDAMVRARMERREITPLDLLDDIPHDHLTRSQRDKLIAEIEAAKSA